MERHPTNRPTPPVRRMMAFIDGENLCARFLDMAKDRNPTAQVVRGPTGHKPVYIWHPSIIQARVHEVLRATYYTSATAENDLLLRIKNEIRGLTFHAQHNQSGLTNNLTPFVNKKKQDGRSKGVDIRMTVDIMTHCHNDNLDTAYIVTGDGDFVPVIEDLLRHGKQVHLAALSSGLSSELPLMVDSFIDLDAVFFEKSETA